MSKKFFLFFIIFIFQIFNSFADKVDKIEIIGNERITKDTILIFGKIDDKADFTDRKCIQPSSH